MNIGAEEEELSEPTSINHTDGRELFSDLKYPSRGYGPMYPSESIGGCVPGYRSSIDVLGHLNGDLNQGAGGRDIELCLAKNLVAQKSQG